MLGIRQWFGVQNAAIHDMQAYRRLTAVQAQMQMDATDARQEQRNTEEQHYAESLERR